MNKGACAIIFNVELFLITKSRYHLNVSEHGKFNNYVLWQTVFAAHPLRIIFFFFITSEVLFATIYEVSMTDHCRSKPVMTTRSPAAEHSRSHRLV